MSINLTKGEKVSLEKHAPGLKKIGVGLGWDENESSNGSTYDLDASVFMLNSAGKCPGERNFIYYGTSKTDGKILSPDRAIFHTGDNLTGGGDGDDETIMVDLAKLDPQINDLAFVVTIYQAEAKKQNFGQVKNAFIRLYDQDTKQEILRYDLGEDFSAETSVEFGRLYLKNGEWKFSAVGEGHKTGLDSFVKKFGL